MPRWPSQPGLAERFWSCVDRTGGSESCWEWRLSRYRGGYGKTSDAGKSLYAHRVAYELSVGPIPPGMEVCHSCDNPPCCNPSHFFLGTHHQNLMDSVSKSRWRMGEKYGGPLTRESVKEIRASGKRGEVHERIAERFGVTQSTVSRVIRNEVWRDSV